VSPRCDRVWSRGHARRGAGIILSVLAPISPPTAGEGGLSYTWRMADGWVLLVDDEEELLLLLGDLLETRHLEAVCASNGQEAMRQLEKHSRSGKPAFTAVVSDWVMPVMDGVALLKQMRAGEFRKIPFVLMSGAVSREELLGAIRYDPDAVLLKPFRVEALCAKIEEAVQNRQRKELERAFKL
jgi:CheY-like chemotaxis protein